MTRTAHSFSGVGGTTIAYDVYEPDGEPKGLILIAHGLGEHRGRYHHVAERLVALGLRVAIPDHRGHGESGGPRCDTRDVAEFTADLESLRKLTEIAGAPTYLLGHSMGGLIALDYALDHQDKLKALMLSGPLVLPGEDQPPWLVAIAKVLGKVVPTLGTLALDPNSVSRDPKVVADYIADPLNFHGKVKAGTGAALLRKVQSFPERLPSLMLPVLVMHGEKDKLTNPEGSKLVNALAGSSDKTLSIQPGLFHEIFNEPEQDRVLDELTAWLEKRL
ncbi:lysophospholipase [Nocardioides sp.]|uniref:alpha/beta hydrolase n=1 Tax=Nocardioides sp. TaxID=35761 RepID=UPI003564736A